MSDTAKLRQVNVTYDKAEDRLLLKVSTSDSKEFRAWCTRRYTQALMEQLEALFESEVDEQQVVPKEARKEVARMKHGGEVSEESFKQPYEAEPVSYPLGEEGVLLTTLRYNILESGVVAMNFSDRDGQGMTLNLNHKLRHQVYELFRRACERAAWFEATSLTGATTHPDAPVVH
ncbi:MAG: hypothetical protein V2I66_03120 [Halieaceae bacterium]|nr:hypothetical protein [Halieaceae bacterium]